MTDISSLPYRLNVGAVLFGADGRVLVARRAGLADAAWQLPQGGIDEGEDPRTAIFRELAEEIGTAHADILAEHPDWLQYDLPPELVGKAFRGRYRGQRQKWFALRFLGTDAEIRLDAHEEQEFDAWKWVELGELPGLAVAFKRPIYERLVQDFAPHTRLRP
jgi:putative (di)nucleoside polyphosphate hydrolase